MSMIEIIRSIGRSIVQKVKSWWSQLRESLKKQKQAQPQNKLVGKRRNKPTKDDYRRFAMHLTGTSFVPVKKIRKRQQKSQSEKNQFYFNKKRTQRKKK